MVDFNNESTITTAPHDIVKILILERRKYVCDAIEHYFKQEGNGISVPLAIVKSRLIGLFFEIQAGLKRDLPNKEYNDIKKTIFNCVDIEQAKKVFETLNDWFDTKRLTRIDTIKSYDSSDVETENKAKGV